MASPSRVRSADIRQRLATGQCSAPGCGNLTTLGRFCVKHGEHHRRHGSAWRRSFTAGELKAYRRAALEWLIVNAETVAVRAALYEVERRYKAAGPAIEPRNAAWLPAPRKAAATWSRLRDLEVDRRLVLAAAIAVVMRIEHDRATPVLTGPDAVPSASEYRDAQIAKVILRMAGGTVKRWAAQPIAFADPATGVPSSIIPAPTVMRSFRQSEGRVLRIVGREAYDAAFHILDDHKAALATFTAAFMATHSGAVRAYPGKLRTKPKARLTADLKPTYGLPKAGRKTPSR